MVNELGDILNKYGSDKKISGYDKSYCLIFDKIKNEKINFLEIGLGTLQPEIESTFVGNKRLFPEYLPANCLRAWREYFTEGQIFGIDIADDCMITEDRIQTFKVDSSDRKLLNQKLKNHNFDIIIDDGLHTALSQINTIKNLFDRVTYGGYYIIEDIGGSGKGDNVFDDYSEALKEIIDIHEYYNGGNFLCVRKNYSGNGLINTLEEFVSQRYSNNVTLNNTSDLTIVTGLWNIGREGRPFDHYIEHFKKFLDIPLNLFIYIPSEYEYLVWEKRDRHNTYVKIYELENIKTLYSPFWDKTQEIRNNPEWYNQLGENSWLTNSPQATLEWYNPIVQSKMFLLNDVTIWNPFDTQYFIWLDAGITNTVSEDFLIQGLPKINKHLEQFLFLSYPYETNSEIHGFNYDMIKRFSEHNVDYVCRGGLFGGRKDIINMANSSYYTMLQNTLESNCMGTEESIFTILSYREPYIYRRYELDGNGLIVKYIQALIDDSAELVPVTETDKSRFDIVTQKPITDNDVNNVKTNLYILTFNFPEQLEYTINSMLKTPEWLTKPKVILLDNSTDNNAIVGNMKICEKHNFEYINLGGNTGINGGRQYAAEHFHESDADFMFFFEDDMTSNPQEYDGQLCRNGFTKYVPNLYNKVHKIMLKDKFDFLKLTFTEVYFDNDKQCSWYNVPQHIRTRDWPNYDKLPISGLDPNVPLTNFNHIRNMDGLSYIDGEVYYCNWPMLVSKEGNKKMFIDTKWTHPFEQTFNSFIYQETKLGNIKPAILLASPIWHDRIKYYKPEERREN